MMQKAWSSIEDLPYYFSRSSVELQGHTGQQKQHRSGALLFFKVIHKFWRSQGTNIANFVARKERFRTVTLVWIPRWIWNDAQNLMSYKRGALLFLRSSIKFQGHKVWKIDDFNPIWVRLLGLSQLPNPSDFPCWKIFLKMSSVKWWPFWPDGDELTSIYLMIWQLITVKIAVSGPDYGGCLSARSHHWDQSIKQINTIPLLPVNGPHISVEYPSTHMWTALDY